MELAEKIKIVHQYRFYIAFFLFCLLVIFKIHGSSIGYWDEYLKDKVDIHQQHVLFGKPRGIKSDEWLVQTPMYLAQVHAGYPLINPNIRADGENMVISYYTPVLDITALGKPFHWGFFLFGGAYGLSWLWNSKWILLFLCSYELSMFLTKRNMLFSWLGALWITLSPPIQWWFGSPHTELIIFAEIIIVCFWNYFAEKRTLVQKTLLLVALTSCIIGYVLTLYPPIQVSLGYLILIFIVCIFLDKKETLRFADYAAFIGAGSIVCFTVSYFFIHAQDAIQILSHTSYPGQRFITGGGYGLINWQLDLVNWRLPYKDPDFLNSCEISHFYNFLPIILSSFVIAYKYEMRNRRLIMALFLYMLFLFSWLFVSYPAFLAKITLFSYAYEPRVQLVLGLISIYLSIWLFGILQHKKLFNNLYIATSCCVIAGISLFSIYHSPMASYLGRFNIIVTIVYFGLLNYFFLKGLTKPFVAFMLLLIVASGLLVNPVATGLEPIYNKNVSIKIIELNRQFPQATWVALNSLTNGNLLVALGAKSLNSVHYYPDLANWSRLDPEKKYYDVYNRYAHVLVTLSNESTKFELKSPDSFLLQVTYTDLDILGVQYILSAGSLDNSELVGKVHEIYHNAVDNIYIYQMVK